MVANKLLVSRLHRIEERVLLRDKGVQVPHSVAVTATVEDVKETNAVQVFLASVGRLMQVK